MKFICPLIVVSDIKRAKYFYETLLGQSIKADHGENIVFHGDFSIHEKKHYLSLIGNHSIIINSNSFELYFEENNIEMVQKNLLENNIEFLHPIQEQPWKQKVMRFYDYDKTIIEVGESLEYTAYRLFNEGYTVEDIKSYTYLKQESIVNAINKFNQST
jgi:uncharacterized glyoxalase superfamily protein PhnB